MNSHIMQRAFLLFLVAFGLAGCGINAIPTKEEKAIAAWSQVENQYQRRADLVPNLVETVKGFATQERDVFTAVVEARAKATQTTLSVEGLRDPQALETFQQSQSQLGAALSRLMAVSERYPDLKSSQNFLTLQAQLEGTENRIAVARRDYIDAVRLYNTELRTFPGRWWKSMFYKNAKPMAAFTVEPTKKELPEVSFQ